MQCKVIIQVRQHPFEAGSVGEGRRMLEAQSMHLALVVMNAVAMDARLEWDGG